MKKILFTLSGLLLTIGLFAQRADRHGPYSKPDRASLSCSAEPSSTPAPRVFRTPSVEEQKQQLSQRQQQWQQHQVSYRLTAIRKADIPQDKARITFGADELWEGGEGYQLLLDKDCNAYSTLKDLTIFPSSRGYAEFEYKIPENATPSFSDAHVIVNGSASIDIETGKYDMFIVNPTSYGVFFAEKQLWHSVQFHQGFEYIFHIVADYATGKEGLISAVKHDFEVVNPGNRIDVFNSKSPIDVQINNIGYASHITPLKLYYQFNGGTIKEIAVDPMPTPQTSLVLTIDTVDMRILGDYHYKIWIDDLMGWTSTNDTASYTISSVGALPLPFKENFDQADIANTLSKWTIVDIGSDLFTWDYQAGVSSNTDKPSGCMAYSFTNYYAANDLLISPLLAMATGKNTVSFKSSCRYAEHPERLKVWINDKKSLDGATLIDSLVITNETWNAFGFEFNLDEAKELYLIFHACSDRNMYELYFDEVKVNAGSKQENFESELKITYIKPPYSSCDLGTDSEIQVMLKNDGLATAQDLSLTCKINDVTFTDELTQVDILPNSSKLVTLTTKPDLTALGSYKITISGRSAQQEQPISADSTTLQHLSPLVLPINTNFNNTPNQWTSDIKNAWIHAKSQGGKLGYWQGLTDFAYLSSGCFQVTKDRNYRVNLSYSGGEKFYVTFYDHLVIYAGQSGTPISTWDSVGIIKNIFTEAPLYASIEFKAKESGHMAVALRSHKAPRQLRIYHASIELIELYDIATLGYRTSIPEQIPAHFVSVDNSLDVLVNNQGDQDLTNVYFNVYDNDQLVAYSDSADVAPSERAELRSRFAIPTPSFGKHTLKLIAHSTPTDEKNINDTLSLSYVVTDTLLARDRMVDMSVGIGSHVSPISIGQLYKLPVGDTLSSISICFPAKTQRMLFDMAIYLTYPAELQDTALKFRRLVKLLEDLERPTLNKSGFVCYPIQPMILPKGDYYVEVRQKTVQSIQVGYDNNYANFLYLTIGDSAFYYPGVGALGIRLGFGNHPDLYSYDAQTLSIQKPARKGMFAANEPIEATVINNGSFQLNNMEVKCQVGSTIQSQTLESLAPGAKATVAFEMDLSAVGKHQIMVFTTLPNDENIHNDTLKYEVECFADRYSPYILDFEACEDFAISGFIPGWTSVDVNRASTFTFIEYTFPYMGNAFGFIAFNPNATTPPMNGRLWWPHEGERFGACVSEEGFNAQGVRQNNDWLISPKLKLGTGSKFEFYARGTGSFDENFQVWVSTSTAELDSFVALSEPLSVKDTTWKLHSFDLAAYNGQSVHVAIQCTSEDAFIFGVDDLKILTSTGISTDDQNMSRISLYPNPAQDYIVIYQPDMDIEQVQIFDMMGREVFASPNIHNTHYRIHVGSFLKGLYIVHLKTKHGQVSYKFLKQ